MVNAIILASALSLVPAAVVTPPPSPIVWSLEGRIGINEFTRPVVGLSYTPDVDLQLGLWIQAEEIEQETVTNDTTVILTKGRSPWVDRNSYTTEDKRWVVSGGISWKFH